MENATDLASLYLTGADSGSEEANGTSLPQFPFWRETLAVWMITSLLTNVSVAAVNLTLFVTMLKTKKLRKPINFIHMSILVTQTVTRVLFLLVVYVYMPPAWANCDCSIVISYIIRILYVFGSVYEPVAFAFLSCLQLLTIKGQKKLGRVAAAFICFSLAYSAAFIIEYIVIEVKRNFEELVICSDVCIDPDDRDDGQQIPLLTSAIGPVILSFLLLAWIPSLITITITATWSCLIFKQNYTGGDDQLNRRILSIPFIMPTVVVSTNIFSNVLVGSLIQCEPSLISIRRIPPPLGSILSIGVYTHYSSFCWFLL